MCGKPVAGYLTLRDNLIRRGRTAERPASHEQKWKIRIATADVSGETAKALVK